MKLAQVTVERIEDSPPGEGVPAGWLPDTIYRWTVVDIPYRPEKPEYTISLRPKGAYLLRRLAVRTECVDEWEFMVSIGNSVVCPRQGGRYFGEEPCWPPTHHPLMVRQGEDVILTLWRRPLSVSKHFECILRGAEESVLPKGDERSILKRDPS
jgi:hypothetical protein